MKKLGILIVVVLFGFIGIKESIAHPGVSGYFYTSLTPYGTWIEIDYGVVVWRPTIIRLDWSPYMDGRWIWTSDGWYWDSYEPFGYITYHYGRWYFDDYYGWLWYPDNDWAPAWVEWRYDDYYIGWAPLSPYAYFSIRIGIHFTHTYYAPYYHWHFVSFRHFCDPYVYNYYIPPKQRYRIYSNTTYRTRYTYRNGRIQNHGIDVKYVRVRSGQTIRERDIIRVRDSRQINETGIGETGEIKTYVASRDELTRNDVKQMDIQKDRRKTSLDISKVKIGDRNQTKRLDRTDKYFDRTNERKEINNRKKENMRKDVVREVNELNKEKDKKKTEIQKKKNVKTNNEVFRNTDQKKQRQLNMNEKKNVGRQEVKTEKKNINRFQTNENRQTRVQTNTYNKKIEVKRNNNTVNFNQNIKTTRERTSGNNDRKTITNQKTREQNKTTNVNKNDSRTRNKR